MNETVNLSGVPETMLQTVYARAKETRTRGAIHDDKAVELVEKLHYDFSLADKDAPALVIMEGLTMYLTQTDVQQIFAVIAKCFDKATVFVEIMNPSVVKHMKEKSIEGSHAKFTWGVRGGAELQALLPGFTCTGEHSLVEGMAEFMPIYKVLGKLPAARSISNKIVLLEKSAK